MEYNFFLVSECIKENTCIKHKKRLVFVLAGFKKSEIEKSADNFSRIIAVE